MLRFEMILQVTLLGSRVVTDGAIELAWINVELDVLFEVTSICCFVVTVWAVKRFRAVVNLSRMTGYFVLVRGHVTALITFKWLLT